MKLQFFDDRGFVKINGDEAKSFLQNIVTNDIEKITNSSTYFLQFLLLRVNIYMNFYIKI